MLVRRSEADAARQQRAAAQRVGDGRGKGAAVDAHGGWAQRRGHRRDVPPQAELGRRTAHAGAQPVASAAGSRGSGHSRALARACHVRRPRRRSAGGPRRLHRAPSAQGHRGPGPGLRLAPCRERTRASAVARAAAGRGAPRAAQRLGAQRDRRRAAGAARTNPPRAHGTGRLRPAHRRADPSRGAPSAGRVAPHAAATLRHCPSAGDRPRRAARQRQGGNR